MGRPKGSKNKKSTVGSTNDGEVNSVTSDARPWRKMTAEEREAERKEIARIEAIMARAGSIVGQQHSPPVFEKSDEGDHEIIVQVTNAPQVSISDNENTKPSMVQKDEEGWQPFPV